MNKNCPLCGQLCDFNGLEYACPTEVLFETAPRDDSGLHIFSSPHFIVDEVIELTYIDQPPFRLVFSKDDVLVALFKGVAGMQFEHLATLPSALPRRKNISKIIKRAQKLRMFL